MHDLPSFIIIKKTVFSFHALVKRRAGDLYPILLRF